jgi:fatty-acyl-CoA synthase
MTEMSGYVTALHWQDPDEVRATQLGAPLPGVEMRIVDGDGNPTPPGEAGEIRVRGPGLFRGYHKQPQGSGLDAGGWFCTGDLGRIDAAGVFHFAGRSKDLLRVKGINVSPLEVEAVLAAHPDVEAAYVVGIPDAGLDQQVVACIVPRAAQPAEGELRELAARALSSYKRPASYLILSRDDVPLGGTSKPQRRTLAELAIRRLPKPRGQAS